MSSPKQKWLTNFIPLRHELIRSAAWQLAPPQLRRMLDCIAEEHLGHGGFENGNLFVPYSKFTSRGISRRQIRALIELGEGLGLLECRRDQDLSNGLIRPPNAYALTYVPKKGRKAPTDEWKTVSKERAKALVDRFRQGDRKSRKLENDGSLQTRKRVAQ